MEPDRFDITFSALNITPPRVARAMGYRNGIAPDPFPEMIRDVLAAAPDHVEIQAGFRLIPPGGVELEASGIRIENVKFDTGRVISRQLEGISGVAIFAATAGGALDAWSKGLFGRDDTVSGFIVDSLGSEIAEGAADWIEERISRVAASRGWKTTNRFSPGYCGWPVRDQHDLFSFLPEKFCGITLTETALMIPMKSVSGIMGMGAEVRKAEYPCRICGQDDCYRRRAEYGPP